jgi:hypothetical protein
MDNQTFTSPCVSLLRGWKLAGMPARLSITGGPLSRVARERLGRGSSPGYRPGGWAEKMLLSSILPRCAGEDATARPCWHSNFVTSP